MCISFNFFSEGILDLVILLFLFSFSLFFAFDECRSHEFYLFRFEVEVYEIFVLVGLLADHTNLFFCLDFFQSLSGDKVPTSPKGNKFVETIVF